jgi:hypothetical protein
MRGLLQARHVVQVRTKQAVYATATFALICDSVYPFLDGRSLHSYWESWGKFLLLVSMTLWPLYVWVVGRAISAWIFLRRVKRIEREAH